MTVLVKIQNKAIDLNALTREAAQFDHDVGAQVSFTGFVRGHDHATPISHLFIDHYPSVTEKEIERIIGIAQQKWPISAVIVVHRVEKICVGEPIVWVMVQAKNRVAAYAANEFIMDYLKVAAPFWKKECFDNLEEQWVAAKVSDQNKFQRWGGGS